jgi:two-component system CheB/CheR fusion protein
MDSADSGHRPGAGASTGGLARQGDDAVRRKLQEAVAYLKSVVEDYEAATEELASSQEELQSANEELQNLNEELTSSNEQLVALNDQLQGANQALERTRTEISWILRSAGVGIVAIGMDLRIRYFTPPAEEVFNLKETDIGRPVDELQAFFGAVNITQASLAVLETLTPKRILANVGSRHVPVLLRPYLTSRRQVAGIVIMAEVFPPPTAFPHN